MLLRRIQVDPIKHSARIVSSRVVSLAPPNALPKPDTEAISPARWPGTAPPGTDGGFFSEDNMSVVKTNPKESREKETWQISSAA